MWELIVARILREVLAAGARRDWEKMISLAKELEELARAGGDGHQDRDEDKDGHSGHPDGNPG